MPYELIIIGGGPAGAAAGVYAARKELKTLIVTKEFGGQSVVSEKIENWIGTPALSGADLAKALRGHLEKYRGPNLEIKEGIKITALQQEGEFFTVTTETGETYQSRAVLLALGSSRRKLTVPGATEFENKGITYCASCDGPLFAGQAVAVIGGGNAGFESAAQLLAYCQSVTLLNRSGAVRADPITLERLGQEAHFTLHLNADLLEIKGDKFVTGLVWQDKLTGQTHDLAVGGIFVEIGHLPATALVKDLITLTANGAIVVDPRTQATSKQGIWAAGDCTDGLYHQNNIAAGDAVKALEDIYLHLRAR